MKPQKVYMDIYQTLRDESLKARNQFHSWLMKRTDISPYDKETIENSIGIAGSAGYTHDLTIKGMMIDFLDEQGIYIDIDCESISVDDHWEFTIDQKGKGHEGNEEVYSTRKQAEIMAIIKAFEILEKRITTK